MRAITTTSLVITQVEDPATGVLRPLFAFPVSITSAVDDVDVRFETADSHGFEVETQYVSKGTGEIVATEDLIKGIRQGDSFSTVSAEDIDAIKEATKIEEMVVERSLPLSAVDPSRVVSRHFLQAPPKGGNQKAYEALRRGLAEQAPKGKAKKGRPALGLQVKFMTRSRQKLGVVYADGDVLALLTLSFAEVLREPDEALLAPSVHAAEMVSAKEVGMVRKVVEGLASDEVTFDSPTDEALALKRDLVEQALNGEAIDASGPLLPAGEAAATAADLEAILEASLSAA